MNPKILFMCLLLILTPFTIAAAKHDSPANVVVLTADDVHQAFDIEAAFHQATGWGEHPGTVILDGRRGPFSYEIGEGNDYAINIFYSNLTLRGINHAVIIGDGINFDAMPLENILIEGLTLLCPHVCILSPLGEHRNVSIRRNTIDSETWTAIGAVEAVSWTIVDNQLYGDWAAVHLVNSTNCTVAHNEMSGFISVMLHNADGVAVRNNRLQGIWQGVLIMSYSDNNRIISNTINGIESAGIAFEADTIGNRVIGNVVSCAPEFDCITVSATGDTGLYNKIRGNKP